jgi:hypothetical protein|tara:strand:+ start:242 stop:772 length:531 start_codon:yes stop_codon:yes gene_type:complete
MLDFAELRNRILMGEGEVPEEVQESPITKEFLRPATGFPILFGGLSVALVIADKMKLEMLSKEGEYNYRPLVLSVFGFLPLGFGLGELVRGLTAQTQFSRYEKLVEAAEEEVTRLTEEGEEQAQQDNTNEGNYYEAEPVFNLGLGAETGVFGGPLIGQTMPTIGPAQTYEQRTFGW